MSERTMLGLTARVTVKDHLRKVIAFRTKPKVQFHKQTNFEIMRLSIRLFYTERDGCYEQLLMYCLTVKYN